MNLKHKKINYTIEEGLVCTKMSSTVSNENPQIEYERKIFNDVFGRYGLLNLKVN
jgi:hypothetical protein